MSFTTWIFNFFCPYYEMFIGLKASKKKEKFVFPIGVSFFKKRESLRECHRVDLVKHEYTHV